MAESKHIAEGSGDALDDGGHGRYSTSPGPWGSEQQRLLATNIMGLDRLARLAAEYGNGRIAGARAVESIGEHLASNPDDDFPGLFVPDDAGGAIGAVLAEHPGYAIGGLPPIVRSFEEAGGEAAVAKAADLLVAGALAGVGSGASIDYFSGLLSVVIGADAFSGLLRDVLGGDPIDKNILGRLPPIEGIQDIGKRTCLLGLSHALHGWAREAAGSVGKSWSTGIAKLTPDRGCAGTQVTISGAGFGAAKPSDVNVAFAAENGGCALATVVSWSDKEIVVIAPARVGRGCVGFVQWGSGGAGLQQAASQLAGEMVACLGPAVAVSANRIEQLGSKPLLRCAPCLPGRLNYFDGGPPTIVYFHVNGKKSAMIGNNENLTLSWSVEGADQITIIPIQNAAGTSQLPPLSGTSR